MLDHLALQLDREEIAKGDSERRGVGGDYSREAINRGTAVILGNVVIWISIAG